jgi:hypothetical protein
MWACTAFGQGQSRLTSVIVNKGDSACARFSPVILVTRRKYRSTGVLQHRLRTRTAAFDSVIRDQ